MTRQSKWIDLNTQPAPDNVPLQVRCVLRDALHAGAVLVLPLMAHAGRWRHINRSPDEAGAWVGDSFHPTHWQHFADPILPEPPRGDDADPHELVPALARYVRGLESAPQALERMAAEDAADPLAEYIEAIEAIAEARDSEPTPGAGQCAVIEFRPAMMRGGAA